MSAVEQAAAVLAEHHCFVGPMTGAWTCPCGESSTNGSIHGNDLTSREDRRAEQIAHVAEALAAAGLLADP